MFVLVEGLLALFVALLYATFWIATGMLALMAWGLLIVAAALARGIAFGLDRYGAHEAAATLSARHWCDHGLREWRYGHPTGR